ncbi:MAG: hypothetical protein JST50_02645 [Bacteroidetes bacterium]|nr:hypothetical protein [Bacteroidota bacterium]
MNYLAWNNLLGNYFFNANWQGKEVFLYISKSTIQDLFKNTQDYTGFLEEHLEEFPEDSPEEIDAAIWDDFCRALKLGTNTSMGPVAWFDKVNETWDSWEIRGQHHIQGATAYYPLYLAYLVALILPLTENEDDFSSSNYYDRAVNYLKDNGCFTSTERTLFTNNYERFKTSFSNQFRDLDHLWYGLSTWSIDQKQGLLGSFNVKIIGGYAYVGKPFGECIITRYQRQLIPLLFELGNLQVGEPLPEGLLKSLLARHGQALLRYPPGKWQAITSNESLLRLLVDIAGETYASWTGSVRPDYGSEKEAASSQSVFNAYLSIFIDRGNSVISDFTFRFFQPDTNDEFEDLEFKYGNQSVTGLTFYHNGWAKAKTALPLTVERILDQRVVYQDALNQLKAIHAPSNVYLFSADPAINGFTSKSSLTWSGEYYVLCKFALKSAIESWLTSCGGSQNLSHFRGVPEGWLFYVFRDASASLSVSPKLQLPAGVTIEKTSGMKMEGNMYLNFWPLRFLLKGLKPGVQVHACAEDGTRKLLSNSDGWYEVKPQDFSIWQKVHLETGEDEPLGPSFQFQECVMATNWCEPGLDQFGFADAQNREVLPLRGLQVTRHPETYPIAVSQLYYSRLADDQPLPAISGEYRFNDTLLYTVSCRNEFDLTWFKSVYENCAYGQGMNSFGSREVKRTLYHYHQLGFLNYHYIKTQRKHHITLNRPTFLNLPMKVATSSHFQVLLTGARTPALIDALINYCQANPGIFVDFSVNHDASLPANLFLPQVVTLKARSRQELQTAAEDLNIVYQPEIYYPLSLVKHAPSIRDFDELLPGLALDGWQDYTMAKTVVDNATLQTVKTTEDVNLALSLTEYYPGTYQSTCILWKDGVPYEIDKNWGKYYLFYELRLNTVLSYRVETGQLFVPVNSPLPKILARALCLMTGLAPALIQREGIWYHVYRMPGQLEWNILNDKLNQRNHI